MNANEKRGGNSAFAICLALLALLLFATPIAARALGWQGEFEKEGYVPPERGQRAAERFEKLTETEKYQGH